MSYIVRDKDELNLVKDLFDLYQKEKMNIDLLEEIVRELIPRDKNGEMMVGYRICESGGGTAAFSLSENYLNLSIKEMYEFIDKNLVNQVEIFNIKDVKLFKDYLFFYIVFHEIEHSYQYLMAYDVIDYPCELVRDGYKLIIDTVICRNYDQMGKLKILRNYISYQLYYMNSHKYIIERNANVEAFDLLQMLAMEHSREDFVRVFNGLRNSFAMWGYVNGNKGCFIDTCDNILLGYEYRKLNHNYLLSDIDRFRYGLLVSKEFREELGKVIKIKNKKRYR